MRAVAKRSVIAGVAVVALAAIVVGAVQWVSRGSDDDKPIQVGTTDQVTSLDPAGAYDAGSWALFSNVYQSLMTFQSGSDEPVPDAARECDFTDKNLLRYACELRPGLRFASGRPVTAADVKFSFDRIRRIHDSLGPLPLLSTLKQVRTVGSRKVVFDLSTPDATFPFKIATGAGSIVDRHAYSADRLRSGSSTVGSGPYVLKSYRPGGTAELRPNPHYQGYARGPRKAVDVRYYDDAAQLRDAWQKHQLDVTGDGMPPSYLAKINPADPHVRVSEGNSDTTHNMVFNVHAKSAAHQKAVRQAVADVVDRDAIARDALARTVDPLYSLIPQGFAGHTTPFYDNNPQPNPSRARSVLKSAGIQLPVRFTLGYNTSALGKREAQLVAGQLDRTGLFTVRTVGRNWTQFQKEFAAGDYDAFLIGWVADFPDPETFTAPLVGSGGAWHNGYHNARVDQLIHATQRQSERTKALRDFRTIQKIVADDVPVLPLWQQKSEVLSTESIGGAEYLSDQAGTWALWRLERL